MKMQVQQEMALYKARQEELNEIDKPFGPGDFAELMKTKKSGFGSNLEQVTAVGKALTEAGIGTLPMIAAVYIKGSRLRPCLRKVPLGGRTLSSSPRAEIADRLAKTPPPPDLT